MPTVALIIWPLVSLCFFAAQGPKRGLIFSVILGYMFLPSNFEIALPGVPDYGKRIAISFGLLLGFVCFPREKGEVPMAPKRSALGVLLIIFAVVYPLTSIFIFLTNQETLVFGPMVIPGLRPWDILNMAWGPLFFFVPVFLGWRYLSDLKDQRAMLKIFVVAALCYSLLVLFEARMSPQLHRWVYGYFPHDWIQHVRGGGFRPVVFMNHGLVLGLFLLMSILGACTLVREGPSKERMFFALAVGWLFLVLLASRNFGALLLAMLFVPMILFLPSALQIRIAAIVAIVFLIYPVVRQAGLLPIEGFTNLVGSVAPERAHSFSIRLQNEQALLERALQKPLFGWGGFGRSRIFNEFGRDISLTDGLWIIILGLRGWVGYIAYFGAVTVPLIWLLFARKRIGSPPVAAGIAIVTAANLIDMVPNAELSPIALMMIGGLAGYIQLGPAKETDEDAPQIGPKRQALQYSRFEPKMMRNRSQ